MGSVEVKGVTFVWPLAIIVSGAVVLAFFGKDLIQSIGRGGAQDDALNYGTPENVARQLNAAIGWFSSDEDEILRIAREEVPSKGFFEDVKDAYRKLYNTSLLEDISGYKGGLDATELRLFLDTINNKR